MLALSEALMSGIMSLFVFLAFLTIALFAISTSSRTLLIAHYLGTRGLSKILAVTSSTLLSLWLFGSAFGVFDHLAKNLSLYPSFSKSELILFSMVVPLFFTLLSPLASAFLLTYGAAKFLSTATLNTNLVFFIALASFSMVLADRLPWIKRSAGVLLAYDKLKDILVVLISFIAITELIIACFRYDAFLLWFAQDFGVYPPMAILFIIALALIFGWTLVAMGYYRALLLPVLSLGTIYAAGFLAFMPLILTNICFFLGLALTLSQPHRMVFIPKIRAA